MIQWQKSSFSNGNDGANCVKVASFEGELLLCESDNPPEHSSSLPPPSATRVGRSANARDH